jgi:hypothetical protein
MRTFFTAAILSVGIVLIGCQDQEPSSPAGPSQAITGATNVAAINALIDDLFDGGKENAALKQFRNVDRQLDRGEVTDAIAKAFDLIDFILTHFEDDRLNDPNGGAPPTTEEGVNELISLILQHVGGEAIPEGALGPMGAFVMCDAGALCNASTGDERASFFIPAGVTNAPTVVAVGPLDPFVNPFEPFGLDGFPLFREFTAFPEIPTNGNGGLNGAEDRPIIVELCVLDPPHPLAPPVEILSQLRIAHIVEGIEGPEVDIAPLAEIPGGFDRPDCTNVNDDVPVQEAFTGWRGWTLTVLNPAARLFNVRPLYAAPSRLGGAISAFSPFGAVDPESGGGPSASTTTLVVDDDVLFDGDVTEAHATVDPAPSNNFEPEIEFIIDGNTEGVQTFTAFLDDGEAWITIECAVEGGSGEADVDVDFGTHTIQAEFPGAPDVDASSSNIEELDCFDIPQ